MESQCKIGKTEWQPSLLVFIHFPNAFAPSAFEIGSNSMQSNSTAMLPVVLLLLSFFTIFLFPLKLMVEHSPELWWWIQVPQTDLRCTRKICFLWSDSLEFEHGFVLSLQLIWGGKKWLRVFLSKREWTGILMIWTDPIGKVTGYQVEFQTCGSPHTLFYSSWQKQWWWWCTVTINYVNMDYYK